LSGSEAYASESTLGVVYGVGLWITAFEGAKLALELDHIGLGSGTAQSGTNLVTADYAVTSAWLAGRFVPWSSFDVETFVSLRVGLAVQHIDATGARQGPALEPPRSFSCGLGAAFALGSSLSFVTRLDASGHQLTSDPVGACAVGIGSSTGLGLGIGLAYGFDAPGGDDPFAGARRGRTAERGSRRP
jgi:hypothetical protein